MEPVVFLKKGRSKVIRKREEDSESEDETVIKTKKTNHWQKQLVKATTNDSSISSTEVVSNAVSNGSEMASVDHTVKAGHMSSRPGPVQAKNMVPTTFIDYAPDVCKDYKQTGFCGFGDSCKFLHDREDYKAGWQLDREWEKVQHKKKEAALNGAELEDSADDLSSQEDIPFACFICRKEYVQPIVTRCGHYFCESCAIQRYKKNPNCIICGAGTSGIFNAAKKLQLKLSKKKSRSHVSELSSHDDESCSS